MADGDRLEGRNGDIWRQYIAGASQEAIAVRYEISQQHVSRVIAAVRESIPEEDLEKRKRQHLDLLDELTLAMADLVRAPAAPAFSAKGDLLRDEDGEVVRDATSKMQATDRMARLLERQAKLLGMDAAQKVDLNMQAQQRAAELAAEVATEAGQWSGDGDDGD